MHAFSTRLGGSSEPPYASLNLGFGTGDSRACVLQNRARFGQAVGFDPDHLMILRQVHGNRVIVLTEATDLPLVRGTPGDGLITNRSHLPLAGHHGGLLSRCPYCPESAGCGYFARGPKGDGGTSRTCRHRRHV